VQLIHRLSRALAAAALLAPAALADAPRPASVLVYPAVSSKAGTFTMVAVTNTSLSTSTQALFRYVERVPDPSSPFKAHDCVELYRSEHLTPADTVSVLTACHAGLDREGYLLVSAKDPNTGQNVAHDRLVGSALIVTVGGGGAFSYSYTPAPFEAVGPEGSPTDADFDGRLDFDGVEYEMLPDYLHLDSFLGNVNSRIAMLSLSGDRNATVSVQILAWNDDEFALSATLGFRCWFQVPLTDVAVAFSNNFLANNTPDDEAEVDLDCDNLNDLESGWARFDASFASGPFGSIPNPPLLGVITGGVSSIEGGRLIWGSQELSTGEF